MSTAADLGTATQQAYAAALNALNVAHAFAGVPTTTDQVTAL